MSGSSYLKSLKKAQLTEAAQASSLPNYSQLKVDELRDALGDHLTRNVTTYAKSDNEYLAAYYKRADNAPRSPTKNDHYYSQKISEIVTGKSDEDAGPVVKKQRRKTTSPAEDSSSSAVVPAQTPARDMLRRASINIGSPTAAQLSDAFDKTVGQYSNKYMVEPSRHFLKKIKIAEGADAVRDWASSPFAIAVLALCLEAYYLRQAVMPFKHFANASFTKTGKQSISVPDIFVLLESSFWATSSLWTATSVVIPLTLAYFINIPLKTAPAHNYGTRRATAQASTENQFDPFVYFIAKALISYLVYADHLQFFGLVSNFTISTVNEKVHGGYASVLTSSAIGAAISLYEAVLRK